MAEEFPIADETEASGSLSPSAPAPRKGFPWGTVLRVAFGAAALTVLWVSGVLDPHKLGEALHRRPGTLLAAFAAYLVGPVLLSGLRWRLLLRGVGLRLDGARYWRLHFTGVFFNSLLPGGTGGDLVKGYYLFRGQSRTRGGVAVSSMVLDRLTGFLGLLFVGTATTLAFPGFWQSHHALVVNAWIYIGASLVSLAVLALFLMPWRPAWMESRERRWAEGEGWSHALAASLLAYRKKPGAVAAAIGLSMAVHFGLVGVYALCGAALLAPLSFAQHLFVAPTLTWLNGIPISPAGLGVGEAAGAFLYSVAGAPDSAAEIPALVHGVILLGAVSAAPAYFWGPHRKSGR